MISFYQTFEDVKDQYYDGMVITGAPVEKMKFEEVEYWDELCEIMDWSRSHVYSTLHICWGAQAGLYHHYGVRKVLLDQKCSACSGTESCIRARSCSAALTMTFWCRIPVIRVWSRRM